MRLTAALITIADATAQPIGLAHGGRYRYPTQSTRIPTEIVMKMTCPLGKLDAPGCSVTRRTSPMVGRGRLTKLTSRKYEKPPAVAAEAKIQARGFKSRTR